MQKLNLPPSPPSHFSNKQLSQLNKIIDRWRIALISYKNRSIFKSSSSSTSFHPNSPLNPWTFIRVKNEIETIRASLSSIVGAIHRGVIVYNECTDGSDEVILEFCKKHSGFCCVEYPFEVLEVAHKPSEREYKKTLCEFYEFALDLIPQNEWLIKIDADQIYDTQKLKESFRLPRSFNDSVIYMQMNLHLFEGKVFLDTKRPIVEYGDHFLICNRGLYFAESVISSSKNEICSYETLKRPFSSKVLKTQALLWHFPHMKESRKHQAKIENYVPICQYQQVIPPHFLKRISPDMFNEERILEALENRSL